MRLLSKLGSLLTSILAVFAVMGVLVALLLPEVEHARARARRNTCKNVLKTGSMAYYLPPCATCRRRWLDKNQPDTYTSVRFPSREVEITERVSLGWLTEVAPPAYDRPGNRHLAGLQYQELSGKPLIRPTADSNVPQQDRGTF